MAIQLFPSPFRRSPVHFKVLQWTRKHTCTYRHYTPRGRKGTELGLASIFLYCCELSFPRREKDIFRNIFVPRRSFPPRVLKNSRPGMERRSGREFVLGYVDRCFSNFFKWTEKASFPLSSHEEHEEKDFAAFACPVDNAATRTETLGRGKGGYELGIDFLT